MSIYANNSIFAPEKILFSHTMIAQTTTKSEFKTLLKSLLDAHEKDVRALKKEVSKLEKEIANLKKIESFSSPMANDVEDILEKGRMARDRMSSFVTTGKAKPTKKDWEAILRMYEIEHHDFIFYLLSGSNGMLSGRDFLVCLLVRDGWKEYSIQILLNISSERISNVFRKINGILFDQDTSKNLEKNILSVKTDKRVFSFPSWLP